MSTAVKEVSKSIFFNSNEISQPISMFEDEELELAKSRMNDSDYEFVDVDELISYLRK